LAVLGFPCNQFPWQEPGAETEIGEFCRLNYGVNFDIFAKVDVKGDSACDLCKFLTSLDTKPKGPGKIGWNFEQFRRRPKRGGRCSLRVRHEAGCG